MHTNELIHETSPYLLQHAHNPVNWCAWSKGVLKKAQTENKLLLISIGYSTCHWCHVMEEECFENEVVAKVMNQHFINIKVDREERPDVDQVYMNALQLMTGSGGWPLNIVALPDGRPVWGATFLNKERWIEVLQQLQKLHKNQPKTLIEYASKLLEGIKTMDLVSKNNEDQNFKDFDYEELLSGWSRQFDQTNGGTKGAPKFMMPNNLHFLLRYAFQNNDKQLLDYVNLSLTKMAYGGVFDHINGGFSRYSVDERWHVPHFEKMLYDNAQLVSLYSDAYLIHKNPLFKEVVYKTLEFIKRELSNEEGGFYSALDADSINEFGVLEEGAYYVFTKEELQKELNNDFQLFADYYNINSFGKWEKERYVLIRTQSDEEFCKKHNLTLSEFKNKKTLWSETLLNHRTTKNRPRLDNKIICSWNAMIIKAYMDAYKAFNEDEFLDIALKNTSFICQKLWPNEQKLMRNYTNGKVAAVGFLEDYAHLISAFIALYESTFNEEWVKRANKLTEICYEDFFDNQSGMFFYSSAHREQLISKTIEIRDNVIPSSNSVMAKNLQWLGTFYDNTKYTNTSRVMLSSVLQELKKYPQGFSNWLDLQLNHSHPFYELVICGSKAVKKSSVVNSHYLPNKLLAGTTQENNFPLFRNRFEDGKTNLYLCTHGTCNLPETRVSKIISTIKFN
ncbi:thioredoxin domain-containing protein [Planktosalinus lacus]|uniref:Thioredoxin n=1 Tax=Planktosalinus lacus TaxID=1526573 RepID=A0A8J2Y8V3_9FLAO|nr:thioredoxin domain-containing protein [Planktosalinus lacus]GGD83270.1 thioredoxin [Planktosalinus lacus]